LFKRGSLFNWQNSFACCWRKLEKQTTAMEVLVGSGLLMVIYPL